MRIIWPAGWASLVSAHATFVHVSSVVRPLKNTKQKEKKINNKTTRDHVVLISHRHRSGSHCSRRHR